ncbi:LysR substrate-binding domain-containing protein [Herbaspirillum rhizosphaerae]|uniref:LysR substrate-binding domain-containing protein n=1 Tax=Herbaspirillum rhizosphaerae TaxID=346179 RepID=UPI00067AAA2C|nr:LysR substrate-binding domain-containing protein [Herbaspirillum rhizosphaerae]
MSTRLDLNDLRLFLHIAETGSITAGAERSHLALASASARIRGMEDALGVALLTRERRGVHLTDAGRALLHHARAVLQQMDRMRDELSEYAHGLKGHIRLLGNTASITEFLPDALGAFLAHNPYIDIDLEERPSHEIVQAIIDGIADIGIVADSVDTGHLHTLPFREDHLMAVMPRKHPLARRKQLAFADIVEENFIGLSGGSALQEHLSGHAIRAGKRLQYRVRLRSFDGICRMVEREVGIGILPATAALRCQKTMAIKCIPLSDAWAKRQLLICVRSEPELPGHTRQLLEQLQQQA